MVKVIWVSQQNFLELEGDGFKQWSPLSHQTLKLSWKVRSQSEEFQQAGGVIRQDFPSGKKTE